MQRNNSKSNVGQMAFLPIFIDLQGRDCVVIGGGGIALRKTELLLRAGANVTVIAPLFHRELIKLADQGKLNLRQKDFTPSDLQHQTLAIAATNDSNLNSQIATTARNKKILVNTVDQPKTCDFIMPAIIDRSPLTIAISSGGQAPILARLLKARLESLIPANLGQLAALAGSYRNKVKTLLKSQVLRRRFWEKTLSGAPGELMLSGQKEAASEMMERALMAATSETNPFPGFVALVGAGPGDPDLLTFRALRLLQEADVVVYDRLVSQPVIDLIRRDAEKLYAGKARAEHSLPQEEINRLLIRLAKQGKRVVRLKGGDPFIFGRGGEEIETLADDNIPFIVVPGITAASGCASYAGIPLTHRDYAQSCLFVTGHRRGDHPNLEWEKLVVPKQTLVIYMGLLGLDEICKALISHGMPADMPAALVQAGTTPQQKVIIATVATLAQKAQQEGATPPTLVIIGEVVRLQPKLAWFQGSRL